MGGLLRLHAKLAVVARNTSGGVPDRGATLSELRDLQSLFVVCLGELFRYAASRGYELTLGEGFIHDPRRTRFGGMVSDGVHMKESLHYSGLAQDLNLFLGNELISDGDDPAWKDLGAFWLGLDDKCRWGGNFKSVDSNHFSMAWGGRA
jgi:hypothetical protein